MKNKLPIILITMLFFLWALVHNMNPILIPHLKKACQLTDLQSAFIDFTVYIAYFIMAIPAGLFMVKYGYKKGILLGLLLFAIGTYLFIPSSYLISFPLFLISLFIVASGVTFLETIANPYIAELGSPDKASIRLNFAQSFNGVGAFLAPILGGAFILTGEEVRLDQLSLEQKNSYLLQQAQTIQKPYFVLGTFIVLVLILFAVVHLPNPQTQSAASQKDHSPHQKSFSFNLSVLKNRHVLFAILTLFIYVGCQVGVSSFFIRFAKQVANLDEKKAASYLGYAMIGFMLGRFVGTFLMRYFSPQRLLMVYALINVLLLFIAITYIGQLALMAVLCVPFFMSIMFPTIFSLGLKNLNESDVQIASSLLIMAIVGGAILPLLMGLLSDIYSMQMAYLIPLIGFGIIAGFGWRGYRPTAHQLSHRHQ